MKNALITGKTNNSALAPIFKLLQEELLLLDTESFIVHPQDAVPTTKKFDIVFSIGGDGSFVGASRKYVHYNVPVIAIKGGTVGFLANIDPKDFKKELPKLYQKDNKWTKRLMLSGQKNNGEQIIALNEFLFSSEQKGSISEFTVCINDDRVMHVRADGLLIASPTGSTAYNISAGGPISLPDMELVTITPVCSHILGERPLVIDLKNKIAIRCFTQQAKIWADGQESITFDYDESFTITKPLYINSLHTSPQEFFTTLSRKLGWRAGILKD